MNHVLIASLLLALASGVARADVVAVYDNPSWIDGASAGSLVASLSSLGHTVQTFSGASGAEFAAGLSGASLVVFPEMLNYGQLVGELEPGALTTLNGFVSAGGGMIAAGDYSHWLLNATFYPDADNITVFAFAGMGTSGPSLLDTSVAAGTPYAVAPGVLSVPPQPPMAINAYAFAPPGGLYLYRDSSEGVTALTAPFGTGQYGYLSWGFAGAVPSGAVDGGWVSLLGIMTDDLGATPTPEPSALLLLLAGLPLLASRRRGASAPCPA